MNFHISNANITVFSRVHSFHQPLLTSLASKRRGYSVFNFFVVTLPPRMTCLLAGYVSSIRVLRSPLFNIWLFFIKFTFLITSMSLHAEYGGSYFGNPPTRRRLFEAAVAVLAGWSYKKKKRSSCIKARSSCPTKYFTTVHITQEKKNTTETRLPHLELSNPYNNFSEV